MTLFVLLLLGIVAVLAHLARVVRVDDYGHRPPPVSHHPYFPLRS